MTHTYSSAFCKYSASLSFAASSSPLDASVMLVSDPDPPLLPYGILFGDFAPVFLLLWVDPTWIPQSSYLGTVDLYLKLSCSDPSTKGYITHLATCVGKFWQYLLTKNGSFSGFGYAAAKSWTPY